MSGKDIKLVFGYNRVGKINFLLQIHKTEDGFKDNWA